MGRPIDKITLKGFKSIRALEKFKLGPLNILIGANGSGKSNFVSFFTLIREMVEGRLQHYVNKTGGADIQLFLGPKETKKIEATLTFGLNGYGFVLEPTADNRLIFADERIYYKSDNSYTKDVNKSIATGHSESKLKEEAKGGFNNVICKHVYSAVASWTVYHFHDTSDTAAMRREGSVRDNERLRESGDNLAAYLYRLRDEDKATYSLIEDTIRLVAPFFKGFKLRTKKKKDDELIELEWVQKNSDHPFHASQLSDGTLRFIALTTALLQPDPPATILIDEPELGLHPYALNTLASLIRQARQRTQLIVSTQSAGLLNAFEPKDVVVIDRAEGESRFRRLTEEELTAWLDEEYSLGELWQKEVYGGGPVHE
jgi:predicted ATPase